MDTKILEALDKLLRTCLEAFGPGYTVLLIILVMLGLFGYRFYQDWRKGKEVADVVKAKDETIQVLAEQNRQLRVIELRNQGWSHQAIEKVVLKNTPKNALEARQLLEADNASRQAKGKPDASKKASN